jgi:hypothetical protein
MYSGFLLRLPHFHFAERSLENHVYNMWSCIVMIDLLQLRHDLLITEMLLDVTQSVRMKTVQSW